MIINQVKVVFLGLQANLSGTAPASAPYEPMTTLKECYPLKKTQMNEIWKWKKQREGRREEEREEKGEGRMGQGKKKNPSL